MQVITKRIPFAQVIADDNLMGLAWKELSVPQQVILKAAYGLPLESAEEHRAWAILNDNVVYDDLYVPQEVTGDYPYEPEEYKTVVGLIGRRSGKSHISCFAALYEIVFGGHMQHVKVVKRKQKDGTIKETRQEVIVPYIAQDLPTAKANMIYIKLFAEMSPMMAKEIVNENSNVIEFRNGIKVQPEPPVLKTGRGVAIPVVILDEVGFWYKTADSANPDFEVLRAVRASMAQFPNRKRFIISSPYTEEGILWEYAKAGTKGRKSINPVDKKKYRTSLVMQASTAAMENPQLIKAGIMDTLIEEQAADPEGYIREYGARFVTAVGGYLPRELVQSAIVKGRTEHKRKQLERDNLIPYYIAAMDPAFRVDSWAFTIMHRDMKGKLIQDVLKVWTPDKKNKISLDPGVIMQQISEICKEWDINTIYSDQYQLESLQQIALMYRLAIAGMDFTGKSKAKVFGSFKQSLQAGNVELLDIPIIYQQLAMLQYKMGAMGNVQIYAPAGKHDDVACVIALAANCALTAFPTLKQEHKKEKSLYEEGLECIKRKSIGALSEWV